MEPLTLRVAALAVLLTLAAPAAALNARGDAGCESGSLLDSVCNVGAVARAVLDTGP